MRKRKARSARGPCLRASSKAFAVRASAPEEESPAGFSAGGFRAEIFCAPAANGAAGQREAMRNRTSGKWRGVRVIESVLKECGVPQCMASDGRHGYFQVPAP